MTPPTAVNLPPMEEIPPMPEQPSERDQVMGFLFATCEAKQKKLTEQHGIIQKMYKANKELSTQLEKLKSENEYLTVQLATVTQNPTVGERPGLSQTVIEAPKSEVDQSKLDPIPISPGGTPPPVDGSPIES